MYKILYLVLNREKNSLSKFLKERSAAELQSVPVARALQLWEWLLCGNIPKVFSLLGEEEKEGTRGLMKLFLEQLRLWGLMTFAKSFGREIKLDFVKKSLKFEDLEETVKKLEEYGMIF